MKIIKTYIPLIFIFMLSSCTEFKEPDIENIESYKFKGFKDNKLHFEVTVPITNPNKANIVISEVNLQAFYKNSPLGIVETSDKIIIKKNTSGTYTIPIKIKITNLMAGLSMLSGSADILKNMYFEGYIKALKGLFFTKINIDKSMSSSFIKF